MKFPDMQKNILITGATGSLGQAVVKKFIEQGHRIIAIVPPGDVLADKNPDIVVFQADLTDEQDANRVIGEIITEYSNVDAALLLVGGYTYGNIATADGGVLKKMLSLNFETSYFTARPIFQQMLKQKRGGEIVFIGARPALNPSEGKNSLAYGLSKSLIFKLADYLNAEGSAKNIKATVVVPSIIDTPPNREAMPDADFSKWVKPEGIAEVIAFVCSGKGQILRDSVIKVYGLA